MTARRATGAATGAVIPLAPLAQEPKHQLGPVWNLFSVRWSFLTKLCGSIPADPAIVAKWLEFRRPTNKVADARSLQEVHEEVVASLEAPADAGELSQLQFQRHDGVLVMRAATVKAHFKDCARVISNQYAARLQGERAFSTRIINGLYVDERRYWIPILGPDGLPVREGSGFMDKPVHVRGPRGEPINALKRIEYVEPPSSMEFVVKVLGKSVSEDDLNTLMEYGGVHGYAGERSDGEGRYEFEIRRLPVAR